MAQKRKGNKKGIHMWVIAACVCTVLMVLMIPAVLISAAFVNSNLIDYLLYSALGLGAMGFLCIALGVWLTFLDMYFETWTV